MPREAVARDHGGDAQGAHGVAPWLVAFLGVVQINNVRERLFQGQSHNNRDTMENGGGGYGYNMGLGRREKRRKIRSVFFFFFTDETILLPQGVVFFVFGTFCLLGVDGVVDNCLGAHSSVRGGDT